MIRPQIPVGKFSCSCPVQKCCNGCLHVLLECVTEEIDMSMEIKPQSWLFMRVLHPDIKRVSLAFGMWYGSS